LAVHLSIGAALTRVLPFKGYVSSEINQNYTHHHTIF
jgi:hypothetical protein